MSGSTPRPREPARAGHETSAATALPYRRGLGRALAVSGILLVALNLRAAITSLSPIYDQIGRSFPLTTTAQGILGMLPPLAFALFGALAPRLEHKLGLEKALVLAMALVCAGQVVRSLTSDIWLFGIFSVVCLAGMGLGNVLLPPTIKEYFPNHIGLLTSLYTALTAVSAALPSLVAVPVTQAAGWRFSTGMWAALAFAAAVPWVFLLRDRQEPVIPTPLTRHAAWRWPTAWALAILFGVGALNTYAMIAWLPRVLTTSAGVGQATAGTMLSIYNGVGLPHSLLVPIILTRIKRPYAVIAFATACLLVGYAGLAYDPAHAWGWIIPAGLGLMLIPIGLTLINLRSRTEDGTAALSGFVQGVGYLIGALGSPVVGQLHALTGAWTAAFWFLMGTALVAAIAGVMTVRPANIEDA